MPHITISSTILSTMDFNVAKIASARASSTKSLTMSLRVAGPLVYHNGHVDDHYFFENEGGGLQPLQPPSGSAVIIYMIVLCPH